MFVVVFEIKMYFKVQKP